MECKAQIAKRYDTLVAELGEAYAVLYTLLARLPVPLLVVRRQEDDTYGAALALSRAWDLIGVQQVSEDVMGWLREMITDWLTAFELAVSVAGNGPAPWRVDGMDGALARFSVSAEHAAAHLLAVPAPAGPGLQVNPGR